MSNIENNPDAKVCHHAYGHVSRVLEHTSAGTGRQRRGCYVGGGDAGLVASMGRRRPATSKYVPKRLLIRPNLLSWPYAGPNCQVDRYRFRNGAHRSLVRNDSRTNTANSPLAAAGLLAGLCHP